MQNVFDNAAVVLIILLITFQMIKLLIRAYFAAKLQFMNNVIEKAKELQYGKTQQR